MVYEMFIPSKNVPICFVQIIFNDSAKIKNEKYRREQQPETEIETNQKKNTT